MERTPPREPAATTAAPAATTEPESDSDAVPAKEAGGTADGGAATTSNGAGVGGAGVAGRNGTATGTVPADDNGAVHAPETTAATESRPATDTATDTAAEATAGTESRPAADTAAEATAGTESRTSTGAATVTEAGSRTAGDAQTVAGAATLTEAEPRTSGEASRDGETPTDGEAEGGEGAGRVRDRWWPPRFVTDATDRRALLIWLCSHIGFLIYTYLAAPGRTTDPFLNRLTRWDAENFIAIAEWGYDGPPGMQDSAKLPAFFPGMALLVRLLRPILHDGRLITVLISLVASAVAAVALSRLAEHMFKGSGTFAVAALFLSPFAAFLHTGYSESLFLALAFPAWLLARKGRWDDAALCAAAAASVRISGLFLALGLVVMWLVAENGRRAPESRRQWLWLALPAIPVGLYTLYHWTRTGDLLAYNSVQAQYWGRHAVWPWEAFLNTWNMSDDIPTLTTSYYEEIVAAAVLLGLAIWLAVRRRWPELTYMVPQVLSFLTLSSFYLSIGRASLTWFPLWLALGYAGVRRPWLFWTIMAIMLPVMAINVGNFTTGAWIG
ncbi:mannosyltransferase family protein [Sphaerisporangium dianthi]|uniref:Mannosyltransferase family protein n=1 Tax=Sphaerisporangium dianthi TaxID=1436120 RepID=A0ABV9CQC5_9ACTN